jgi:hypothetical protein
MGLIGPLGDFVKSVDHGGMSEGRPSRNLEPMTDDLDIFDGLEEVEPTRSSNPRLPQVIGALVVGGLLIGIVVSVIVSGIASISPTRVEPGSIVCDGAAICDNLTLAQVRSLTGIPFADDATVAVSSYAETDRAITLRATVVLAEGSENPFDAAAYGIIANPTLDWSTDDLTVLDYFAASGEQGTLYAEAVHAIDDRVRELVLVEVVRTL